MLISKSEIAPVLAPKTSGATPTFRIQASDDDNLGPSKLANLIYSNGGDFGPLIFSDTLVNVFKNQDTLPFTFLYAEDNQDITTWGVFKKGILTDYGGA